MKKKIDTEKLYDIIANKLTWLMEYGEDVYLAAGEDIRSAIQEAAKPFDVNEAIMQLEKLEEQEPVLVAGLCFGTIISIFRKDAALDVVCSCGAGNELMNQLKRLDSLSVIRRNETFEALQKDVVLAIVKGGGVDGD